MTIEAMFAHAREAEPHERNAMISCHGPNGHLTWAVNVAFLNGHERNPCKIERYRKFTAAVGRDMIAAVAAKAWPATGTLVWRHVPEKEPEGVYMRCTVIPARHRPLTADEMQALDER